MGYMNVQVNDRDSEISLAASSEWVSVCVSAEWQMNERKAQINCTYIYYVPIYAYIHTLLSKEDGIQPVYFAGILFCAHSHSRKHCTQTFSFQAVVPISKKSRQPNESENLSISFEYYVFFARCINRLWFRYLPLLSHSLRPHICDGWAGLFASQFIHTRGEWVCTCSVVPHMCVQFLLSIYLFIRKRIIINRSRVKSIKCAISWWPHTILPTRKLLYS